jgi:nucleoid-associated protein YgaU
VTTTLESILMAGALDVRSFPANSRYHGIDTLALALADGDTVVYLERRFIPAPETMTVIREHLVEGGDRLDKISAGIYGDPELFWQICDANRAMQPQDLTETAGVRITIAMATGIAGSGSG